MSSTTKIKERPILYSGPMVLATMRDIKTQTRRVVKFNHKQWLKPLPHVEYARDGMPIWFDSPPSQSIRDSDYFDHGYPCPYGVRGDRLWVREAFGFCTTTTGHAAIRFKADGAAYGILARDEGEGDYCGLGRRIEHICDFGPQRWKPSIHMPRWASRILLELTDVRVERLQEITLEDAAAEGIEWNPSDTIRHPYTGPIAEFVKLWDSINGPGSWDANPWVWALTFKRLEVANGR